MSLKQFTPEDGQIARRYDYEDESVLVVDFGTEIEDATADLVDGTVIVVVDSAERSSAARSSGGEPLEADDQYEFDLPEGATDAHTFIRNGVLTVELEDTQ